MSLRLLLTLALTCTSMQYINTTLVTNRNKQKEIHELTKKRDLCFQKVQMYYGISAACLISTIGLCAHLSDKPELFPLALTTTICGLSSSYLGREPMEQFMQYEKKINELNKPGTLS